MIRFIDISNGNVFDGSQPYTFWFDNGQSVNINYVRNICFVSTESSHTVTLDSRVFTLLDVSTIRDHTCAMEIFDQRKYYSLDPVEIDGVVYPGLKVPASQPVTLNGTPYQDMYVYMIYILANSSDAGEVTDQFYIDSTPYNIGADFYNEDERLSVNLGNLGTDLPYEVQKAIYDGNVHEDLRDNIMLNRKYKELLMQYFDIVTNKGNYKSLIDALNWFEYGDLVQLREFWNESKTPYYYYETLDRVAGNDFMIKISEMIKKTYIGIYLGLKKLKRDGDEIVYDNRYGYVWNNDNADIQWATLKQLDGNPVTTLPDADDLLLQIGDTAEVDEYEGGVPSGTVGSNWQSQWRDYDPDTPLILNELNPVIENISAKCSVTDLALKMTMLGNFYSTYFMPIHLDLLHSTVESLVYSACVKILHSTHVVRWDTYGHFLPMHVNMRTCGYLGPLKNLFVYEDTLFKQTIPDVGQEMYELGNYIGVEEAHANEPGDLQQYRHNTYLKFGGIACKVNYECSFKSYDAVTRERIIICNEHMPFPIIRDSFNYYEGDDHDNITIDFSILLFASGHTRVSFMFWTANGNAYVHTHEMDVRPDARRGIYMCKVKRRERPYMIDLNHIGFSMDEIGNFMFGQADTRFSTDASDYMYSQVLSGVDDSGVGLNHVVAFKYDDDVKDHLIHDGDRLDTSSCTTAEELVDYLSLYASEYSWYLTDGSLQGSEQHVLGISKRFVGNGTVPAIDIDVPHLQDVDADHYVCELRFLPVMHQFEITDEYKFSSDDVLAVVPVFGENITRHMVDAVWVFKNVSTGEVFESRQRDEYNGDVMAPFVAHYDTPMKLSPGYYDVELRYRYSRTGDSQVLVRRHMFKIV